MRSRYRWFLTINTAAALCVGAAVVDDHAASAQPVVRDHRKPADTAPPPPPPEDRRGKRRPPRPADGPTSAPPADKAETPGERAGYVWAAGNWDWKAGAWAWVPGHWERARKAKRWRPGKWEDKGGTWEFGRGGWRDDVDDVTPPPVTPADDRPREAPPTRREEKQAARAGYVWAPGDYEWKNRKWEWVAGHWERERKGKKWRDARWEQRDGFYVRVDGDWVDEVGGVVAPPPGDDRPREAPPTRREEKQAARAGYVWVPGDYDWKDRKWEWVAGHWEREQKDKKWRDARWEQRDGFYVRVDGEWIAEGAATEPPPDRDRRRRRDWKLERPTVSSYWPTKGKPGARVVIRGKNFPTDATVLWAGTRILGARITPTEIRFMVPNDAASGELAISAGRKRPMVVGSFEVAAAFDAEAERKRLEDEARAKAEAMWAERQRRLSKDRASRLAAVNERWEQRASNRDRRRADRVAEIRAKWAERAFLADLQTQDELALHAQRVAELDRMRDLAEVSTNGKLAVRIEILSGREDDRHAQRMLALQASFNAGGTP